MRSAISSFSGGLFAAALLGSLPCAGAFGQLFTWTNSAGGDWNTDTNWNPIGVPDGAGKSALINLGGTFAINFTGGGSPDSVQLLTAGATLNIADSSSMGIGGASGFVNNGLVVVNAAAGTSFTSLRFAVNGPLSGSGTVRLNASSNLFTAYIETTGGAQVLHQSPHKILGTGSIAAKMTNSSQIIADVAGKTLQITGAMTQTAAGQLRSAPGIIELTNSASLAGGSITGTGAGKWQVRGDASISGVTSSISGTVLDSGTLRLLSGGMVNNWELNVNNGLGLNFTQIRVDESCTVSGSGNIFLQATANLDTAYIASLNDTVILTNKAPHRIDGTGRIYAIVENQGQISGSVPGRMLEIRSKINQTAGASIFANDAEVGFGSGSIITGGHVSSLASGKVRVTGDARISGITLDGPLTIDNGQTLHLLAGGVLGSGTITVNSTAGPSFTQLRVDESCQVGPFGSIVLNASANLDTAYIDAQSGAVLTNSVNQKILGVGRIYAPVVNNGIIRADVVGSMLEIRNAMTQSSGGRIEASPGFVGLGSGSVISGGTFATAGAGEVRSSGAAKLSGPTNTGILRVANGTTIALLAGGLINNSNVYVNNGGLSFTSLFAEEPTTIGGNGTLTLLGSANPDTAYLDGTAAGLTNGASHKITGDGRVYGKITNLGTIRGSSNDSTMTLRLRGTITQQGAGKIVGDVGVVGLDSGTVNGGTFESVAGPVRILNGESFANGVENKGQLQFNDNSRLVATDFINSGTIIINSGVGLSFTSFAFNGVQTLSGLGTVLLRATANPDTAYLEAVGPGAVLTFGPAQTIRGTGRFYGEVASKALLSPGVTTGAIGRFEPRGPLTLAPESRIDIDIAGGDPGQFDAIASNSAVALGGSLALAITGWDPSDPCISIPILSGSVVTGEFVSVTIDSPAPPAGRVWRLDYEPNQVSLHLTCAADLNGDCVVDDADFTRFVFAYNLLDCADPAMPQDCPSDLNHDGVVDDTDFTIWIVAYNALLCS